MTSIIVHTRRPNTQENFSNVLGVYVSAEVHFSYYKQLKSTFFISLYFTSRVTY